MATMIKQGFWIVLPASLAMLLPGVRLAPVGIVPARDRRPRTIVDYTFWGQNIETIGLNPNSMQYGKALDRILYRLETADTRHGPMFLLKIDISDGYYRVPLQLDSIPKLGALLPKEAGEEQLVAFPTVLPMGWKNSAPIFCAATETIADIANERLRQMLPADLEPHRLECKADSKPPRLKRASAKPLLGTPKDLLSWDQLPPPCVKSRGRLAPPLASTDVFVDDLVSSVQGSKQYRKMARRLLLEAVDDIFRPLEPTDRSTRKEPISVKKLLKGDGYYTTRKVVLGWLIDTLARTIELPSHRVVRLREMLSSVGPNQSTVSRRKWQQVLGELRSMSLALPASRGMFSQLQAVLTHSPDPKPHDRMPISQATHDALDDFRWLADSVATRPTRWGEIVPQSVPEYLGAEDASAKGMGGVWFPPDSRAHDTPPLLWRHRFDTSITSTVVSWSNPAGVLTNSDLELVAHVAAHDVLVNSVDMREKTAYALSDNTPTLSWARRGSVSTDSSAAYLLRLHALHQRYHRYCSQHSHIPGSINVMADDLSRLWHLSDDDFLTYFTTHYPQTLPWKVCHLRPTMNSALISALLKKRSDPESLSRALALETTPSGFGSSSVNNLEKRPSYSAMRNPSPGYSSTATASEKADYPKAATRSDLELWRKKYWPLQRGTPYWDTRILDTTAPARSTSGFP